MPSHVDQKHILRLEWLPLPDTPRPVADELLLAVPVDVVGVDVGDEAVEVLALRLAPRPAALVVVRLLHAWVAVVNPLLDVRVVGCDDSEFRLEFAIVSTHHGRVVHGVRVHKIIFGGLQVAWFLLHRLQTQGDQRRRDVRVGVVETRLHLDVDSAVSVASFEDVVIHVFHLHEIP